jgi:predicted dehydrogenase
MGLRWGIVGCGEVAVKKAGPSFQHTPGTRILAVTDARRERAEAFARQFSVERVYGTLEDLLADPEIDAVYLATPPAFHHPHTLAAAAAHKHVLCEKPMALNVRQCREMLEACRRTRVDLTVAYYRRFWPQTAVMKDLIAQGEIGDIVNARIQVTGNVMLEPQAVRAWKLDPRMSGGGFLMDVGCHRIDLLLYLLGEVTDVAAFTDAIQWDYAVDNSSNIVLRFRSGALAMGAFNWTVEFFTDEFEIIGTKGKIVASPLGGTQITLRTPAGVREIPTPRVEFTHAALLAAVEAGAPDGISGEPAIKVNQVIEAAYVSSRERRAVCLQEIS